jgi:hypothetical protein
MPRAVPPDCQLSDGPKILITSPVMNESSCNSILVGL